MSGVPWTLLLQAAAVINALLLALALLLNPRLYRTRARIKLAAFLAAFSLALTMFTAMDRGWLEISRLWVAAEYAAALLAGTLLVDFTAGAVGARWRIVPIHVIPAFPAFLALGGPPWVLGDRLLAATLVVQVSLTGIATWTYWRFGGRLVRRPRHLGWLIGGLWCLHAAQLSRLALPSLPWLYDAIPVLGASLILGLTFLIATDSRSLRALIRESAKPGSDALPISDLEAYMREEKPHLDPGMDLGRLAEALGVPARGLSTTLNEAGLGFYEFLYRHRVEEAKNLLANPDERRTSVEAIGLMVGFRARSTFYEAFRRETGMSPAEWRRKAPN